MTENVARLEQAKPLRHAPHNAEAEAALIGALLVNNDIYQRVSGTVEEDHFYLEPHRRIFRSIAALIGKGKTATAISVKTDFRPDEMIGDLPIATYLLRLHSEAATTINAVDYARMVRDLAVRRALIGVADEISSTAYEAPLTSEPREQIEQAERRLFSLAEQGRTDQGFVAFSTANMLAIEMANAAQKRAGHLSGVSSGLTLLDRRLGGLQKSDLIVLAGRPGMGKTALATNVGFNVARAWRGEPGQNGQIQTVDGGVVGFFSLEMSCEQLAMRIISEQAGVPSYKIRQGMLTDQEFDRVWAASETINQIPFWIDQTGGLSIGQIAARARRLKRQRGLDVLIIDYIQLLSGNSKRGDNRVQEVTEITTGLKALAKDLQVPIIALSQLSRQVESRDDKRPQLSDLRESGSIEQDADVVLFVFREEYYMQQREPRPGTEEHNTWQMEMDKVHGQAEVIVGKNRHGPTGTLKLQFQSDVTRFSDLAEPDHVPERMD